MRGKDMQERAIKWQLKSIIRKVRNHFLYEAFPVKDSRKSFVSMDYKPFDDMQLTIFDN